MPSDVVTSIVAFLVTLGMGLFGSIGVVNPELSFRLHNLFQVRRVEMTQFGRAMYYYGGLLTIVISFFLTFLLPISYTVLYLAIIGTVLFLYRDSVRSPPVT